MSPPKARFIRARPQTRARAAQVAQDPYFPDLTWEGPGGTPSPKDPTLPESQQTLPATEPSAPPLGDTTTTTTTPDAQSVSGPPASGMTGDEFMALLGQQGYFSGAPSSQLATILRPDPRTNLTPIPTVGIRSPEVKRRATEQEYDAEYWEYLVKDPVRRRWWAQRAITLGVVKYDPKAPDFVPEQEFSSSGGAIHQLWTQTGEVVRMNPVLNANTPEAYLDGWYNRLGGDEAFEAAKTATLKEIPNPIQTTKQINTYTMSKVQADAVADQMAMALLGHMANPAEMKTARGVMNGILKANPTVTTTVSDNTDINNQVVTSHTNAGASPADAQNAYEMKLRRSSEGMAFNVGKLMETAMMKLDQGL